MSWWNPFSWFSETESEEKLVADFREVLKNLKIFFDDLKGLINKDADVNEIIVKYTELFRAAVSLINISKKLSRFSKYKNLESKISWDLSYFQKGISLLDRHKNHFDYDKAKEALKVMQSSLNKLEKIIKQFSI